MSEPDDPGGADSETGSGLASVLRHLARAPEPVELAAGTVLAERFEIVREIGRGGFGRVYAARDRVLARDVAIKLLAYRRLGDRELELFCREARATARLNHPNIVTAYDRGEWQGAPFLVLELLEGRTLAAELAEHRVSPGRAWQIVRDIARAVAYAHSRGVLHLDLKSHNVFVQTDGTIKVLDFGLAGLDWDERARIAGGTPATMAPEQKRGEPTDARTDLWAIGVILHELLFSALPAEGAPVPARASRRAAHVLRRTLAPLPADRFADAAALLAALAERPRRVAWAVTGVALIGAAAATWWAARAPSTTRPAGRHHQLTFRGDVDSAQLSPAGDRFAFVTADGRELWLQRVGSDQATRLLGGEDLWRPRWFPDGERLVIGTPHGWRIVTPGREPEPLPATKGHVVPMPDGATVAVMYEGVPDGVTPTIRIATLAGAVRRSSVLPSQTDFGMDLDVSPTGRLIATTLSGDRMLVYTGLAGGPLVPAWTESAAWERSVRWSPGGVVYTAGVPDAALYERTEDGVVHALAEGIDVGSRVSVSRDGARILYHRVHAWTNLERFSLAGTRRPITQGTARHWGASVSRGRLVYALEMDHRWTLVVADLASGAPQLRIRCPRSCAGPQWSPDGTHIAFLNETAAGRHLAIVDADGTNQRELSDSRPERGGGWRLHTWLTDHELVYVSNAGRRTERVDLVTGRVTPWLTSAPHGWIDHLLASPDGERVVFAWNRSTSHGVYESDRSGGPPRLVITDRDIPVAWSADGRRLVARTDGSGEVITELTRIADGRAEVLWAAPAGVQVVDATAIDGSDDLVITVQQEASDAWLLER